MNTSELSQPYVENFPASLEVPVVNLDSPSGFSKIEDGGDLYPHLSPHVESLLEDICNKGSFVIEPLSSHICVLQEMFLDTLYDKLEAANIPTEEKITIYLTKKGKLNVLGEHLYKVKINAVLAQNPGLAAMFIELSSSSELARDIININRVFAAKHEDDEEYALRPSGYHLSLKGGMSHFFFV